MAAFCYPFVTTVGAGETTPPGEGDASFLARDESREGCSRAATGLA